MKSITLSLINGKKFDYACNNDNRGVFIWNESQCNWEQLEGTYQTPRFKNYKHFRRYLGYGDGFKMINKFGW